MKHKTLFFLLVVIILLFTSCSSPEASLQGEGFVKFVATEQKGLDVVDSGRIDHYEYTAVPLFEKKERLEGKAEKWTELEANEQSSEVIGPFTQGKWAFELRAMSVNGVMLWYGKTEYYINAAVSNIIPIELKRAEGTGFIEFRLNVPEYSTAIKAPIVTIDGVEKNITWEESGRGTGSIVYHSIISSVSVGWHSVTVRIADSGSSAGEAMAVEVSNGNYVFITGSFDPGKYTESYLHLDEPQPSRSEIKRNNKALTSDEIKRDESVTYTYSLLSGRNATEIIWFVNGEEVSKGKDYVFKPQKAGIYELSVIGRYYAKSTLGKNWIEESSSSSITVFVEPKMSVVTWVTGSVTTRQLVAYDTVLTLGSPKREGYEFNHWAVTGAYNGNLNQGDTLEIKGATYTLTAIWDEEPCLYLIVNKNWLLGSLNADPVIGTGDKSSFVVKENKPLRVALTIRQQVGNALKDLPLNEALRWFVNGKEVYYVVNKTEGIYEIPVATEGKIEKGTYPVTVKCTYKGEEKQGSFNLTWL